MSTDVEKVNNQSQPTSLDSNGSSSVSSLRSASLVHAAMDHVTGNGGLAASTGSESADSRDVITRLDSLLAETIFAKGALKV